MNSSLGGNRVELDLCAEDLVMTADFATTERAGCNRIRTSIESIGLSLMEHPAKSMLSD